jgi:hypothetical protein
MTDHNKDRRFERGGEEHEPLDAGFSYEEDRQTRFEMARKQAFDKLALAHRESLKEKYSGDVDTSELNKNNLEDRNFVHADSTVELLDRPKRGTERMELVDTDSVIGTVSPSFSSWSTEYDNRTGRLEEVARELIKGSTTDNDEIRAEAYEHVFHPSNKEERIKLFKILGLKDPIYIVEDGSHRIAGTKLAEMPKVLAEVCDVDTKREVTTDEEYVSNDWQNMIDKGLIEGQVVDLGEGSHRLEARKQLLPWCFLERNKFFKMSKAYESASPEALSGLKSLKDGRELPREIFTNEVPFNFFMAGRWEEYAENYLEKD